VSEEFDMDGMSRGDNDAWRKSLPLLQGEARHVLIWKLGLPLEDAKDLAQVSLLEVIKNFKFVGEKTFKDLKHFTRAVAYRRGIDWLRAQTAEKRGGGGVLSLDEEVGEGGLTRLDFLASKLESIDSHELADILSALVDCRKNSLNEKENDLFHAFYILNETQEEIAKKRTMPIGSVGTTLIRALEKLKECLRRKGIENPFQ
jgi:RNA polymerase sigma factor (sigma-70 family)